MVMYKIDCPSDLRKMPIRPTEMPIRSTKNAHPTYVKCLSDLRKMLIRPTENAHPTYEKCPSDLNKIYLSTRVC